MAVQDIKAYPLSTPGGLPIPLDIIRCAGLIKQAFSAVAVNGVVIPACDYLFLYSDQKCVVALGRNVVIPANGAFEADEYVIPPGTLMIIDHQQATTLGVIRIAFDGVLWIQCVEKYKDVRKSVQFAHN